MDKVMIVTGASRGIGAATAILAAERGYAVCVNYVRNRLRADEVVATIRKAGGRAIAIAADVAREHEILRMYETVDREFGRVDVLVNNAGVIETQARVEDVDAARLVRLFNVNVVGSFLCAREAIRRMSTKHGGTGGSIVNVSSVAARLGASGEYVDYAATKGAIDTFTVGLAREVANEGIRVNSVRPGFIYTEIHAEGGEPGRVDRIKDSLPMKRGGEAIEVARAILWLASDEASYSTGSILEVAGGR